jgi:hypothetical protein
VETALRADCGRYRRCKSLCVPAGHQPVRHRIIWIVKGDFHCTRHVRPHDEECTRVGTWPAAVLGGCLVERNGPGQVTHIYPCPTDHKLVWLETNHYGCSSEDRTVDRQADQPCQETPCWAQVGPDGHYHRQYEQRAEQPPGQRYPEPLPIEHDANLAGGAGPLGCPAHENRTGDADETG